MTNHHPMDYLLLISRKHNQSSSLVIIVIIMVVGLVGDAQRQELSMGAKFRGAQLWLGESGNDD